MSAGLRALLKMAVCQHDNRAGGNDYVLCADCNLMWDYRREQPQDVLHGLIRKALQSPADPSAVSAGLREAVQTVLDTFRRDEAQGYSSRDRQFAIDILAAALAGEGPAQDGRWEACRYHRERGQQRCNCRPDAQPSQGEDSGAGAPRRNDARRMTTDELSGHLRTILEGVEEGDSLEGSIEYTAADVDGWDVRGAYRIDNLCGQGSSVLLSLLSYPATRENQP